MTVTFEKLAGLVQNDDVMGVARHIDADAIQGVDVNGRSLLFLAAASGATDAGLYLLDSVKLDVNAADVMGETPLMRAATQGNLVLLEGLLKAGASVDQKAIVTGGTALHAAYAGGKKAKAAVDALLAAGADPTIQDKRERVPADWAAEGEALDNAAKLKSASEPRRVLGLKR